MDSIPFRKRIRILKGKSRRVCRSTESRATSVGRPGPVDRSFLCTPVHAGRPGGRPASSGLLHAPFLTPLSSDLCATSFHLFYLLCSIILHLSEDFSNLSRSPTYPSLSPGEIDTRSRRNRYTISAKSTHDLGLESVAQLSTGMHHTCLPYTSP